MTDAKPFAGKLALVTGASRGIGAATAEALAAAGAHVILTARGATALEEVEGRIHDAGGSATIAPMDLTETEHVKKLAEAVAGRWGSLDILVLNAAMLGSLSPVEHLDAKELGRLFALNVFANQVLIAAFDPLLRRSERAEVVGVTSSVGAEPRAFWGGYGASKAALDTMLGAYADETAHAGRLRVHIVDPGATATRMRQLAFPGEEASTLKGPEVVASAIVDRLQGDAPTGERMRVEG
ncbi:SDR family NAD(P)-dependent oxidoreductase [Sphingomonas rhizophila]|uniref:SDR family NAD(P)-dependent oxidoreductase n=1 Tax=Sphingomonas rhizophila TaxID=2071607 RepID=A0A7G9SCB0_9SPHN|nr:SDR family NAD(P)-dependent oxidoreductase [Sphingomonas rhizophila]QNN65485.1 SDR family NAD(P)-dependent oxidoreductase [Sphingomonas rhizophila]